MKQQDIVAAFLAVLDKQPEDDDELAVAGDATTTATLTSVAVKPASASKPTKAKRIRFVSENSSTKFDRYDCSVKCPPLWIFLTFCCVCCVVLCCVMLHFCAILCCLFCYLRLYGNN